MSDRSRGSFYASVVSWDLWPGRKRLQKASSYSSCALFQDQWL